MKLRKFSVITLFLILITSRLVFAAGEKPPFEISISSDKESYIYGEPITLNISVKNISNKKLYFQQAYSEFGEYEIYLNANNRSFIWQDHIKGYAAHLGAAPILIESGMTHNTTVPLSDGLLPYHFKELEIFVKYKEHKYNSQQSLVSLSPNIPVWEGSLTSNGIKTLIKSQ